MALAATAIAVKVLRLTITPTCLAALWRGGRMRPPLHLLLHSRPLRRIFIELLVFRLLFLVGKQFAVILSCVVDGFDGVVQNEFILRGLLRRHAGSILHRP